MNTEFPHLLGLDSVRPDGLPFGEESEAMFKLNKDVYFKLVWAEESLSDDDYTTVTTTTGMYIGIRFRYAEDAIACRLATG